MKEPHGDWGWKRVLLVPQNRWSLVFLGMLSHPLVRQPAKDHVRKLLSLPVLGFQFQKRFKAFLVFCTPSAADGDNRLLSETLHILLEARHGVMCCSIVREPSSATTFTRKPETRGLKTGPLGRPKDIVLAG